MVEDNIRSFIEKHRKEKDIQLKVEEILSIYKLIKAKNCKYLVFGLGNDSGLWNFLNKDGRTVFLEDKPKWYETVKNNNPEIEAYLIKYKYELSQWKYLLNKPELLMLDLPKKIKQMKFDVILVDAPLGVDTRPQNKKQPPGRMMSIYTASKIIKNEGSIFIHDAGRIVENVYADKYLKKENFVEEILGLKHYIIK